MTARSPFVRSAVPVLSAISAAAAGAALHSLFGYRMPLITFFPAVIFSAWFGGFGPGLVATFASAGLVAYLWFVPLLLSHASNPGDVVALLLFVSIGLVISSVSESMHRATTQQAAAREHAEGAARELRDSEQRLRAALASEHAARAEAELANHLKDRFVATVSHELRTPLNALLGWADMLKRNVLTDETRRLRAVEAIHANATRQAQLVDDLLDLAGMMTGKVHIEPAPMCVDDSVRAVLDIMQAAAATKHIELSMESDGSRALVNADGMRLQQVFANLLTNAIKFTPEHGLVRVRVARVESSVEVVITDTGRGIPNSHLASIFEPFHQVDGRMTREHGGLGLGLYIVQYLVEAHHGTIAAHSAGAGRGSTFTVRLPTLDSVGARLNLQEQPSGPL